MKMAPKIRRRMEFYEEERKSAKISSVLVLLYPARDIVYTPLILRASYSGSHSGQISFPGGKFDKEDADLGCTALREAKEEIGIDPGKITLIGELATLYIPPSGFLVHPF